jgi:hypothetical protein
MAAVFLSINIILYLLIIIKCFCIQNKTPFFFNYLIISCLLGIYYAVLLFSQLYFPIFTPVHYQMKEYLIIFQFIYFLFYLSKYNFFYNRSFEKFFACLLQFFIIIFLVIFLATFFSGTSPLMRFFNLYSGWASIVFLSILYGLYIGPTLLQKKFNKYFKRVIILFLITSLFDNIQLIAHLQNEVFLTISLILTTLFNLNFLNFISAHNGRYLND